MAKGKYTHTRSRGKKLSTVTLVFWMLLMLTLVILVLLALGIVYLPTTSEDSPTTDLSAFRRKTSERCFDTNSYSLVPFDFFISRTLFHIS